MPAATPLPRSPSVLTLYSTADLLTAPGCPVCRYAAEASDRYLRWFALEGHAQPATITRLCASLGTCATHTRRLMGQPGAAVRLTAVYRYVVSAAADRLAGHNARQAPCPACEHDGSAARRAVDTLREDLADLSVLERLRDLGGLCLPHLAATSAAARPRLVAPLMQTMRDSIAARGNRCDWLAGTDHDAETRATLRSAIPPGPRPGSVACSPCLAGTRAERDALVQLSGTASGGPDPALALCATHLADAAAEAGASGVRPLLAWQLQCLTPRLASGRGQWLRTARRRRDTECPVCRARRAAAERSLGGPRGTPGLAATDPALCVRHHLVVRAAGPRGAEQVGRGAIGRAGQLAAELTAAFDGMAWAHSHGARAQESTAWRRAASFLDGSVFAGLWWPLPAQSWPSRSRPEP